MLTKLGQRGYAALDAASGYGSDKVESDFDPELDTDTDSDTDSDGDRHTGHRV